MAGRHELNHHAFSLIGVLVTFTGETASSLTHVLSSRGKKVVGVSRITMPACSSHSSSFSGERHTQNNQTE